MLLDIQDQFLFGVVIASLINLYIYFLIIILTEKSKVKDVAIAGSLLCTALIMIGVFVSTFY